MYSQNLLEAFLEPNEMFGGSKMNIGKGRLQSDLLPYLYELIQPRIREVFVSDDYRSIHNCLAMKSGQN